MRTANRLASTSRASRVSSDDADGVAVMLHRLGHRHQQPAVLGAPDIGRHLIALPGTVQPQFVLHVGLPFQARAEGGVLQRLRLVVRQQRQHLVVQPADGAERSDRIRPAAAAARSLTAPPGCSRTRESATTEPSGAYSLASASGVGIGQPVQQRPRDVGDQLGVLGIGQADRALAQRAGEDPRLFAQRGDLGFQQAVLVLVKYSRAATSRTNGSALTSRMRRSSGDTQCRRKRRGVVTLGFASPPTAVPSGTQCSL